MQFLMIIIIFYLLLYFQLNNKEVLFINKRSDILEFYDLNNIKKLDSAETLKKVINLIDINAIMENYIAYLLRF